MATRRLDKVFAVERAKASERIVRITEDNELVLSDEIVDIYKIATYKALKMK